MRKSLSISTPDGSFSAYLAEPVTMPAPVVVVIQEIFGINADMRETCDTLARQGFIAVCPDLFWRLEPGVELTDQSDADWKKAFALYTAFELDQGVEDIAATLDVARQLPGSTGKLGVLGFCLGGLLSFLTASRHAPDAAVAYYGGGTDQHVDEASALQKPLLMHLAEEDEYIIKCAQTVIIDAMRDNPLVQLYTYPDCNHAFARHSGTHYDAAAAKLANARTLAFLQAQLSA